MTPAFSTEAPPASSPAVSWAAMASEDSRVSMPRRTRGCDPEAGDPEARRVWASARPMAWMVAGSSGG